MTTLPTATLLISALSFVWTVDMVPSKPAGKEAEGCQKPLGQRPCLYFLNAEYLSGLGVVPRSSQPCIHAAQHTAGISKWGDDGVYLGVLPPL